MNKTLATTIVSAAFVLNPFASADADAATRSAAAPDSVAAPAKSKCGGVVYATPFKRSKAVNSNCGKLGSPGHVAVYSWGVNPNSDSGRACLEGWGFDEAHPKGGWFSLGCGTSGVARVPWGNVAAVPKVRAESLNVPLGTFVNWSH